MIKQKHNGKKATNASCLCFICLIIGSPLLIIAIVYSACTKNFSL